MNKNTIVILTLSVSFFILVGCSSNEKDLSFISVKDVSQKNQIGGENTFQTESWEDIYSFPIVEEVMLREMEGLSLKWKIESIESLDDNHSNFYLESENGIILSIDTKGNENSRGIVANFFYPSGIDETNLLNTEQIDELFKLLLNLYGDINKEDAVKFFEKTKTENKSDQFNITGIYRQDDIHYLVEFAYSNDLKILKPIKFQILDSVNYEDMISCHGKMFETNTKFEGRDEVEVLTVAQLKTYKKSGEDIPKIVKVVGKLFDLKGVDGYIKLPSILNNKTNVKICKTALISDKTGEMSVIVMPTTFTKQELSYDRIHYICKFKEGIVVYDSVKQ